MAQAKSLRARLKFQRRTTTDDGYGNLEGAWADLAPSVERYGELKPTRGGEDIQAARLTGQASWDFWVRSDTGTRGLLTGDRAVDVRTLDEGAVVATTRVWNVRFVGDMEGKNGWLLVQLQSGVAV